LLVTNIEVISLVLQPSGHYPMQTGDGHPSRVAPSLPCPTLKESEADMFGLVMVLTLVLMTVASPFAVMAVAKAKSRRK